jgi:hypothetical protein
MHVTRIVSGGQTGADRAALDAAVTLGLPHGGWCPPGGWAEDLTEPPGLLARYPMLSETPDPDVAMRTEWNVRDSDATLVLVLSDLSVSGGTRLTVDVAEELGRPSLVARADDAAGIGAWLASIAGDVLNVAGPRESEDPGVYGAAYGTLVAVLG